MPTRLKKILKAQKLKMIKETTKSVQYSIKENVEYKLIGTDGKPKKLFALNFFGRFLLRKFREFIPNPIENGLVKPGVLNYFSAYGIIIPFITGMWVYSLNLQNLVVNTGKAGVSSRINGSGGEAAFTYIAVGTGAVAPAATDTALGAEISTGGLARAAATASRVTTTVTNDTAQLVVTFNATASFAVTESGVFNAAAVGTMACRQTFSAINVGNGDNLQITWKLAVS